MEAEKQAARPREYKYDTLRLVMIFLVVLGHFLEYLKGEGINDLYRIIYTFHIPVLIFISGYFAKFNLKKIITKFALPYLFLQLLYRIYAKIKWGDAIFGEGILRPYWHLWYLFVMILYLLITPLLDVKNHKLKLTIFLSSIIISLLAGLVDSIGYKLSLSRAFSFLPFFISGLYFKRIKGEFKIFSEKKIKKTATVISLIGIALSILLILTDGSFTRKVLYGSYSYSAASYNAGMKLLLYLIAFCYIVFFISAIPNKKLPLISALGSNTLLTFIIHGYVVKLLGTTLGIFKFSPIVNLIFALLLTAAIIAAFGNPLVSSFPGSILKRPKRKKDNENEQN